MNIELQKSLKKRMIKRVLRYTSVYTFDDLSEKTTVELKSIQSIALINLIIKVKFQNRNKFDSN